MERGPKPAREALPLVETPGGVNGRLLTRRQTRVGADYFFSAGGAGAVEPVLVGVVLPGSAAEASAGPDFT